MQPQRNRLNSVPIVTGLGVDITEDERKSPNDTGDKTGSKKRGRPKTNCAFIAFYGGSSPDSKRKKVRKELAQMKTFKDLNDAYEAETIALSGLTHNIEDENVKDLIESFSPVIRNFPEQIKKEMLEISEKWENRNKIFIGAISYIIHGRKDSEVMENEIKDMGIEKLSEKLIREIENRMPKFCRHCKEWYLVKLDDYPEIHCMWCRVGIHDRTKIGLAKDTPGIKWLCETCEPVFDKHFLPKLDQVAFFEGFTINNSNININKNKKVNEDLNIRKPNSTKKTETNKAQNDKVAPHSEDNEPAATILNNGPAPLNVIRQTVGNKSNNQALNLIQVEAEVHSLPVRREVGTEPDASNSSNFTDVKRYPNKNKDQICRFLTRGSCRYGAKGENDLGKCNRYHPNQCKEFNLYGTTENGCKKGDDCNSWHATYMCRLSSGSNTCPRNNCIYKHHKNCSTTQYKENHFLNSQQYRVPRQYRHSTSLPNSNNRQSYHQRQPQQNYMNNQWPPIYQRQHQHYANNHWSQSYPEQHNQFPQIPDHKLINLIRTVIREERINH